MGKGLGRGDGGARGPRVSREAAGAASDASILWSRWALARLDEVLGGEVDLLIADLARGGFNRGLLDRRFDEVGLDDLFGDDQYRLGVAVAHRSMAGTFVVWERGVTPLGDRPLDWPEDYRRGVAAGRLLDPPGTLLVRPCFVPGLPSILSPPPTPACSPFAPQT